VSNPRKRHPNGRPARPVAAWQPLRRATPVQPTPERIEAMRAAGATDDVIADATDPDREMWRNDVYTVSVTRHPLGYVVELSIRRNDREPARDWRDFQRIKTQIAGADVEAFEMYPAEDRLMDTANHYWLFCLPPGQRIPAGYRGPRNVVDTAEAAAVGAVQRALPADWRRHPV
jgi:hypothetical protein